MGMDALRRHLGVVRSGRRVQVLLRGALSPYLDARLCLRRLDYRGCPAADDRARSAGGTLAAARRRIVLRGWGRLLPLAAPALSSRGLAYVRARRQHLPLPGGPSLLASARHVTGATASGYFMKASARGSLWGERGRLQTSAAAQPGGRVRYATSTAFLRRKRSRAAKSAASLLPSS